VVVVGVEVGVVVVPDVLEGAVEKVQQRFLTYYEKISLKRAFCLL
jgi:hypothetical protein